MEEQSREPGPEGTTTEPGRDPVQQQREPGRVPKILRAAGGYGVVGLEMGVSVALGIAGGMWLDGKLGTRRVFGMVGLLLGVAAAFRALWRIMARARRDAEREEAEQRKRADAAKPSPAPSAPADAAQADGTAGLGDSASLKTSTPDPEPPEPEDSAGG